MMVWKMYLLSNMAILGIYVKLRGGVHFVSLLPFGTHFKDVSPFYESNNLPDLLHPRKLTWIPKMMGLGKGNGTL